MDPFLPEQTPRVSSSQNLRRQLFVFFRVFHGPFLAAAGIVF
jgi:hypothetical protein